MAVADISNRMVVFVAKWHCNKFFFLDALCFLSICASVHNTRMRILRILRIFLEFTNLYEF